jgi:hypothetical protein
MITVELGQQAPLILTLFDRTSDKGVRAVVRSVTGSLIGTTDLVHAGEGTYIGSRPVSGLGYFLATFTVYTNSSCSVEDENYQVTSELYCVIENDYNVMMSTTFENNTGEQEVIAWAENRGKRILTPTECTIYIKDGSGTVKWTGTLFTPNTDGVFQFINPVSLIVDKNYYIVIEIKANGRTIIGQKPFFTV